MYTVTFAHSIKDSIKDNQGKNSNPEVFYGSGSSSDSERQIDVIDRGESGENASGSKSISASTRRSSSSSLSVSSSEPDAFFGMDALTFTASDASELISKSGKTFVSSSESSAKSETDNSHRVPPSTGQLYNLSYNQKGMSPTASPPMQVMDRSGGYPSRIPSSVFEITTNASEWSVASNESLFSIHLGRNSFPRDNPFLIDELVMPEELTKSGELNVFNQTPPVIVEEIDTARIEDDRENLQSTGTSDEDSKSERKLSNDGNEIKTLHQAAIYKSSKSDLSEFTIGSGSSVPSFVPLKKRSRSACCCSNHSCAHCCYKCPGCKCFSCGWAFCCCWNYRCTSCCGSSVFMKTDIPRHQSFKQDSETTSNACSSCCTCFQSKQVTSKSSCANCCNWFHCFSCPSCPSCSWKTSCPSCSWKTSCACKPSCTWKLSCPRCECCC
ncbi:uncharacterized protein LOC130739732 isoform X2 [Lotus japonicus]|nr:uncharacterized protein LOC130739732 isoform X2 [Lotus japonicus]